MSKIMALTVDSFEFLLKEITVVTTDIRDGLALIGAVYTSSKLCFISWSLYKFLRTHGVARFSHKNFKQKYGGDWAVITGSTHGIGKAYAQELASLGMKVAIVSIDEEDCIRVAKEIVVTGCTQGLGEAYVRELARAGLNICLISRNPEKLFTLQTAIETEFNVEAASIAVDFTDGQPVYDIIREKLRGKNIGVLVNNVGVMYEYPDYFLNVPEQKLWQLIHVNVTAATMMTQIILPQMVERRKGAIIIITAGTSIKPMPQMTVYSATKAYLDYFARALNYEYSGYGITIQCLKPFYVATRMSQYSTTLSNPSLWIPTATSYVRQALNTLGWSTYTTGYWPHTLLLWFSSAVPEWLWFWGSSRLNAAFRRQARQRIRRHSFVPMCGDEPPRSPLLPRSTHRPLSPRHPPSPRRPNSPRHLTPPPHSLSTGALRDILV